MHLYHPESAPQHQNVMEIYLHDSKTYRFASLNGPFCNVKWHVLVTC